MPIALSWYGRESADLPDLCSISPIFSCAWSAFPSRSSAFRQHSSASPSLSISISMVALFTYRKGESGPSRIMPSRRRRAPAMLPRPNMRTIVPKSMPGRTTPSRSARRVPAAIGSAAACPGPAGSAPQRDRPAPPRPPRRMVWHGTCSRAVRINPWRARDSFSLTRDGSWSRDHKFSGTRRMAGHRVCRACPFFF